MPIPVSSWFLCLQLLCFTMHVRGIYNGMAFEDFGWFSCKVCVPQNCPLKWMYFVHFRGLFWVHISYLISVSRCQEEISIPAAVLFCWWGTYYSRQWLIWLHDDSSLLYQSQRISPQDSSTAYRAWKRLLFPQSDCSNLVKKSNCNASIIQYPTKIVTVPRWYGYCVQHEGFNSKDLFVDSSLDVWH